MVTSNIFSSNAPGKLPPRADTRNEAGGLAYSLPPKHGLAQYVSTGTFTRTFYAGADEQLDNVLDLAGKCDPEFVAKAAVYARKRGLMKDSPALLLAHLATRSNGAYNPLFQKAFRHVITDTRMLRGFAQIVRSGRVGRKSFGYGPRAAMAAWLNSRTPEQLFKQCIGEKPSLGEVIKMVRPKPTKAAQVAIYRWLMGKDVTGDYEGPHKLVMENGRVVLDEKGRPKYERRTRSAMPGYIPATDADLPEAVRKYDALCKLNADGKALFATPEIDENDLPDAPFQLLTRLKLGTAGWTTLARKMSWNQIRHNLNTLGRNGVLKDKDLVDDLAKRLVDEDAIRRARVFPYAILTAHENLSDDVPAKLKGALLQALDLALANVPEIEGNVLVFVDVSGSMTTPVTGLRKGATTVAQCREVAAMVACALAGRNPGRVSIVPFSDKLYPRFKAQGSYIDVYRTLNGLESGGTDCHLPLAAANREKAKADMIVYLSDNESWIDSPRRTTGSDLYGFGGHRGTATAVEWAQFKARNPNAKLVCIDLAPNRTVQAAEDVDVLNVGGFSDAVFDLLGLFAGNKLDADHWVGEIEKVAL